MKYKFIIFDFDGTLADSFPWFVNALDVVADKFSIAKIDKSVIAEMRKLDATKFLKQLKIPLYKLPKIAAFMRKIMGEQIEEIRLFDGVAEMLRSLKSKGYKIAIVSTNSKENIYNVLGEELSMLNDHFLGGVSLFGKEAKLKKVLKVSGIPAEEAIYIGDEMRDVKASNKVGLNSGAVTWGFNSAEAMSTLNPTEMFYSIEEILEKV